MAKIRRRASLSGSGPRPFLRQLDAAVEVALPFEDVDRAARVCLPRLVTESLGSDRKPGRAAVVSTRRGARLLRVAVHPEVSSFRRRPGALGHVHWHTRRFQRFFPAMEADLIARPLTDRHTELAVDATYRPPGGPLGIVGDAVFGWIVARSTIQTFAFHLAEAMEEARGQGRCCAWSSDAVEKEVASQ